MPDGCEAFPVLQVNKPPTKFKKTKCVYFVKLLPEKISNDNINELVSAEPLCTLLTVALARTFAAGAGLDAIAAI